MTRSSNSTATSSSQAIAWILLACILAATPCVLLGVARVKSNTTDMKQWLPEGRAEVERYQEFVDLFGVDDFVLVTWQGCTVEDDRLASFGDALGEASKQVGQGPLWRRVVTGQEFVEELMNPPASLERAEAESRLQGLAFGPSNQTCVLIILTATGRAQPHRVVAEIRDSARSAGLQRDQLKLAGSVYKVVAIDKASTETMRSRSVWSAVITILITWTMLRSIRLSLTVLLPAAFCGALSIALVHFSGRGLNAVLIVLPTLVYVLTVSGAVHLVNYLRDAEASGSTTPVRDALSAGWKPCTLAALSTAVGMASLVISDLTPVREFGFFSSISLCIALAVLLVMFYAILRLWKPRETPLTSKQVSRRDSIQARWCDACANCVIRRCALVIAIGISGLAVLGLGMAHSTSSVDMVRTFRDGHELRDNYQWIEEHVCSLGAVEVLVAFPKNCDWKPIERLERLAEAATRLREHPRYGPTMSAATFAPRIPEAVGIGGIARRTVINRKIKAAREDLIRQGWLAETDAHELWRIHVRVPETKGVEYDKTVGELERILTPIFEDSETPIGLSFTGGHPLIAEAQEQLLWDLVASFALAFAVLCPVIIFVLRNVRAGLIAMLPNVAPVVVVFGTMGWLGIPIEIGSMLTASVALGIAVDDTLHFLTWYQRSLEFSETRADAIRAAYRRCAPAMIQTTLICGLGMLPLVGAAFVPVSQFAILLVVLLLTALVGDLLLLPALLASRLGAAFGANP